ncbi:MAG: hypothetical protein PW735_03190 [Acidobacteriaceae bacterium]|nr:hypothetical protein [Acidobacteriaceae bacterium]
MTARDDIKALGERIGKSIIGQQSMVERILLGLLANGHLLVEGLPGLAKTRAVKSLAAEMTRWLPFPILLLIAGHCLAAEPFARVAIEDKGTIVPGQQLRLDVTVFAPDFFTSPPQFPLFDVPGAVVTLPDERAQNVVETLDGIQYSGIRRVYAIVPETSGYFSLPPVNIELGYSVDGKAINGEARMPAFGFTVTADGGRAGKTLTFAARNLSLDQSFDRDPASLKVGDALVRSITVFAEDTQAMMIPAVDVGNAPGMKQYTPTSRIDDNVSVGRMIGSTRIQTITYTVDTAGSFVIPEISYAWHDLDGHREAIATLSSTKVTVTPALLPGDAIVPTAEVDASRAPVWPRLEFAIACFFMAAVLGWTGWRLRYHFFSLLERWRTTYRNSDSTALRNLISTIRAARPRDVDAALRRWAHRKGFRSLEEWSADDKSLRYYSENLQRLVYGDGNGVLDREALAKSVIFAHRTKTATHTRRSHLPALNPVETDTINSQLR